MKTIWRGKIGALKKKITFGILALLLANTLLPVLFINPVKADATVLFFDDFNGTQLSTGWNIEDFGGSYSIGNGTLTMKSSTGFTVYRSITPQSDNFTVSTRVKGTLLGAFGLVVHAGSLPIYGR